MIGKLRLLPGATGSNVAARDGYDAEADAAMTLVEFERWLLCQIAIYHHALHSALGGLCPAQMWEREAAKHSPLLPVSERKSVVEGKRGSIRVYRRGRPFLNKK